MAETSGICFSHSHYTMVTSGSVGRHDSEHCQGYQKHGFKCVLLTTGKHTASVCDLGCWYPVNGRSHARQTDRKNETRRDLLHVRTDGLSKNTKVNTWPCRDPFCETTDLRRRQPSSFTLCRIAAACSVTARCRSERHLDVLFSSEEMVAKKRPAEIAICRKSLAIRGFCCNLLFRKRRATTNGLHFDRTRIIIFSKSTKLKCDVVPHTSRYGRDRSWKLSYPNV